MHRKGGNDLIDQLMVQDYILFENAQIDFKNNMSVITGETGAGKSLLIDAIHVISGGRVSKGVVRKGKDKAVLQMILSGPDETVRSMLEENGFDPDEDIILTRIVNANGKSRMLLNSRTTTNAFVSELVSRMVDIHSQMDTVRLMDPQLQLDMLDRFAKTEELRQKTADAYAILHKKAVEIKKLKTQTFSDAHLEAITRQLNEISAAKVQDGELEELDARIEQAEKVVAATENLSEASYYWKKEGGISDQLYTALKLLEDAPTNENYGDKLHDLYYQLQDLFENISDARSDASEDGQSLDQLHEREFLIRQLFKKYGGNYQALMETEKSLNQQVDLILHRQDLFERLEKEKKEAAKVYTALASQLHKQRQDAVPELKSLIEAHARDLMLEHCVFDVHFEKKNPSKDGMDLIEFHASMNPGQPLTPLKQSASGGELSRLMLALKVVFQAENGIGTLVFDEIDTGVSGKVALAMGSKMHALADNYQVLCITHLPSVAVWADDHYRVAKTTDGTTTSTHVSLLSEEEHFEELAIMANGTAEPTAVESMKELFHRVRHG